MSEAGVVWIDGRRAGDPRVSVYDRGFLYGDSVFEVVRTYGGKPFGLAEHVARLHRSAAKIAMALAWSEAALHDEIMSALRESGFGESYIRVIVTRGVGKLGLDLELAEEPMRVVMIHPLTLPPLPVYRDGVAVLIVDSIRATDGTSAEGAKSSNYLANLLALRDAKKRGAYEPVFIDRTNGEVLEGGTSNVFAVFGNTLVTPPERRILGGITRKHVLAAARDLEVRVEPITLERFRSAEEIFLTSTIREVVPIVRIVDAGGSTIVGRGVPGPQTRAIHRAFRGHVGAPSDPMPWEQPS